KTECLQTYKIHLSFLSKLHLDQDYSCEVVGSWNTWYGDQDQAGKYICLTGGSGNFEFCFWKEPSPRLGQDILKIHSYKLKARAIKYRQENDEAVGGFFSQVGDLYEVHHLWGDPEMRPKTFLLKEGWDSSVYFTGRREHTHTPQNL
uniref:NIPSNAP domain-containing protein n=1 Tax=Oncorhynchus tshawytscha TaxID=74940 RepID=A0A8C8G7U6_ONCTS